MGAETVQLRKAWLSNAELAAYLGFALKTINKYQYEGLLPPSHGSYRTRRWHVDDVDAWMLAGGIDAARSQRAAGMQATA